MKILALDTATEACSAALYIDGDVIEQYRLAPREHTRLVLQMAEDLLQQADIKLAALDAIAFGRGPGSFTGVRIATGVAQGMAFAVDLPVIPVSTLASIAQFTYETHHHHNVLPAIDARMGEMYWGCYRLAANGLMELAGEEQVSRPEAVMLPQQQSSQRNWAGAGSAWQSYSEPLKRSLGDTVTHQYNEYLPHSSSISKLAAHIFEQGGAVDASQALPVYLRDNVAKKSLQQKNPESSPKEPLFKS